MQSYTGRAVANRRIGIALVIPEPLVVEAVGRAGYDWVFIDLQHGGWDQEKAFRAIQLLDHMRVQTLVRVSRDELSLVPRVLDHGAGGVIIANLDSPELASEAIKRARYAPEGRRSYVTQRYGMRVAPEPADVSEIRPAVYAMVEDDRALQSIDAIAGVPGLAGLHIGPNDMALALGFGRNRGHPNFQEALQRIVSAGHKANLPVTLHAVPGEDAAQRFAEGFDEIVIPADINLLQGALQQQLETARGGSV